MAEFGFSLSSEQLSPKEMINLAPRIESAGLDFIMVSDHYHPWIDEQGQSPFVWSMLGALSQQTKDIPIGTGVTATIIRIHPAILAQATATTASLLENRFIFGIGSGENLNEHVVGEGWPPVKIRHEMFIESIEIIKELWEGKNVNYYGQYYAVENARLYTLPKTPPAIIASAFGPKAAKIAGEYADGLIVTEPNEEVVKAFQDNGGKGKPMYIQFTVSYDEDEDTALENAHKIWPLAGFKGSVNTELATPKDFMGIAKMVKKEDIEKAIAYGPNPQKYIEQIQKALDLGFTHIYLNQIGKKQQEFMEFYVDNLLPSFK